MKSLLITTAIVDAGAGAALICVPLLFTTLLLSVSPWELPVALRAATLTAAPRNRWVREYWFYNVGTVIVLGYAGVASSPVGIGLWPTDQARCNLNDHRSA